MLPVDTAVAMLEDPNYDPGIRPHNLPNQETPFIFKEGQFRLDGVIRRREKLTGLCRKTDSTKPDRWHISGGGKGKKDFDTHSPDVKLRRRYGSVKLSRLLVATEDTASAASPPLQPWRFHLYNLIRNSGSGENEIDGTVALYHVFPTSTATTRPVKSKVPAKARWKSARGTAASKRTRTTTAPATSGKQIPAAAATEVDQYQESGLVHNGLVHNAGWTSENAIPCKLDKPEHTPSYSANISYALQSSDVETKFTFLGQSDSSTSDSWTADDDDLCSSGYSSDSSGYSPFSSSSNDGFESIGGYNSDDSDSSFNSDSSFSSDAFDAFDGFVDVESSSCSESSEDMSLDILTDIDTSGGTDRALRLPCEWSSVKRESEFDTAVLVYGVFSGEPNDNTVGLYDEGKRPQDISHLPCNADAVSDSTKRRAVEGDDRRLVNVKKARVRFTTAVLGSACLAATMLLFWHSHQPTAPDGTMAGASCAGTVANSDRIAANSCIGSIGSECDYTCDPGYVRKGRHICGSKGFVGGVCDPCEISEGWATSDSPISRSDGGTVVGCNQCSVCSDETIVACSQTADASCSGWASWIAFDADQQRSQPPSRMDAMTWIGAFRGHPNRVAPSSQVYLDSQAVFLYGGRRSSPGLESMEVSADEESLSPGSLLSDFWVFDASHGQWRQLLNPELGPSQAPGGRAGASAWHNTAGALFMFGGGETTILQGGGTQNAYGLSTDAGSDMWIWDGSWRMLASGDERMARAFYSAPDLVAAWDAYSKEDTQWPLARAYAATAQVVGLTPEQMPRSHTFSAAGMPPKISCSGYVFGGRAGARLQYNIHNATTGSRLISRKLLLSDLWHFACAPDAPSGHGSSTNITWTRVDSDAVWAEDPLFGWTPWTICALHRSSAPVYERDECTAEVQANTRQAIKYFNDKTLSPGNSARYIIDDAGETPNFVETYVNSLGGTPKTRPAAPRPCSRERHAAWLGPAPANILYTFGGVGPTHSHVERSNAYQSLSDLWRVQMGRWTLLGAGPDDPFSKIYDIAHAQYDPYPTWTQIWPAARHGCAVWAEPSGRSAWIYGGAHYGAQGMFFDDCPRRPGAVKRP
jgi:hypothetical protein